MLDERLAFDVARTITEVFATFFVVNGCGTSFSFRSQIRLSPKDDVAYKVAAATLDPVALGPRSL